MPCYNAQARKFPQRPLMHKEFLDEENSDIQDHFFSVNKLTSWQPINGHKHASRQLPVQVFKLKKKQLF